MFFSILKYRVGPFHYVNHSFEISLNFVGVARILEVKMILTPFRNMYDYILSERKTFGTHLKS